MPGLRAPLRTLSICVVIALAIAAFVVFGLAGSKGRGGRPAPPLPSERLSGRDVTLASLRGHPVVVSFWASWCKPCEHEAPTLERFSRGLGSRATLVGVNSNDNSLSEAHAFEKRYGWTFPNLRDPEGSVGYAYGLRVLPTTFVIDGAGRVRETLSGPQTQQSLTAALATLSG